MDRLGVPLGQPVPEQGLAQGDGNGRGVVGDFPGDGQGLGQYLLPRQHVVEKSGMGLFRSPEDTGRSSASSAALEIPTIRGRNQEEQASGTTPRRAKTNPILASSAAMRISMGRVMVMPIPTAGPWMAAITGLRQLKTARAIRPPPSRWLLQAYLPAFPAGRVKG